MIVAQRTERLVKATSHESGLPLGGLVRFALRTSIILRTIFIGWSTLTATLIAAQTPPPHDESKIARWIWSPEVTSPEKSAPAATLYFRVGLQLKTHEITRYRDQNQKLRPQFRRILKRAGIAPWPKLFHNLRASRQAELAQSHPIHVVCEWIGNTTSVGMEHYLRVTEQDLAKALEVAHAAHE